MSWEYMKIVDLLLYFNFKSTEDKVNTNYSVN